MSYKSLVTLLFDIAALERLCSPKSSLNAQDRGSIQLDIRQTKNVGLVITSVYTSNTYALRINDFNSSVYSDLFTLDRERGRLLVIKDPITLIPHLTLVCKNNDITLSTEIDLREYSYTTGWVRTRNINSNNLHRVVVRSTNHSTSLTRCLLCFNYIKEVLKDLPQSEKTKQKLEAISNTLSGTN